MPTSQLDRPIAVQSEQDFCFICDEPQDVIDVHTEHEYKYLQDDFTVFELRCGHAVEVRKNF